jgi:sec-independent protein translocase protein TatC
VTTHDVEKTRRKPSWQDYLHVFGKAHRKASVQLETSMPLLLHLEELRQRIFKAFGALILTTAISFAFAGQLINYFAEPIGGSKALVSIEVTENIAIFMRVALLGGVILAMPVMAYQALSFILPGLKKRERTWLLVGVVAASVLFLGGVSFAWFVMIPTAVPFLVNFLGITTHVRPMNYFDFITTLMFWIGICFEMPLVVMLLAKLKFLTARQLAQGWRYAVVGIAVVAALVTPTVDPVNMSLVMLPLLGLYLISILLAAIASGGSH